MDTDIWQYVPPEVIQEFILNAPSFDSIARLYDTDRRARTLLGCTSVTTENKLQFVNPPQCNLELSQINLLSTLNQKFRLGVTGNLSFVELRRAYNRSAANPECPEYSSLLICLKSAARQGAFVQLQLTEDPINNPQSLLDTWMKSFTELNQRIRNTDLLEVYQIVTDPLTFDTYLNLLIKLGIIAYKNDHLALGDNLRSRATEKLRPWILTDKLTYWRVKAWTKLMLAPFKVLTTREIRDKYGETLYDPNVPDTEKIPIWRSKYTFQGDVIEEIRARTTQINADDFIYTATLIKLGIDPGPTPTIVDRVIDEDILINLASQSGNLKLFQNFLGDNFEPSELDLILALKRGYFDLFINSGYEDTFSHNEGMEIWGQEDQYLFKFFKKFSLQQVESITGFLVNEYDLNDRYLFRALIKGNCTKLYFEYVEKFGFPFDAYSTLNKTFTTIDFVPAITDILNRPLVGKTINLYVVDTWQALNQNLFAKIWLKYGKQQYEDTQIYLRSEFGVRKTPSLVDLLNETCALGAVGLLTYIFGYRLSRSNELIEIPSIFKYAAGDLRGISTNGELPIYSASPDMLNVLLDIMERG